MSPAASVPAWLGSPAGRASALRRVSDFPGINAGAKITAAMADLVANGIAAGILDARDFTGMQFISTAINLGAGPGFTSAWTLLLGRATFCITATITVGRVSAIHGEPFGWSTGATNPFDPKGTVLLVSDGAALAAPVLRITGPGASIQDILIDGNFGNGGQTAGNHGIEISDANAVDLERVSVYNAGGSGIAVLSSAPSLSSIPTLTRVFSSNNNEHGLSVLNTNDSFVMQSHFFQNTGDGIRLNNSSALRLTNADVSNNGGFGINPFNGTSEVLLIGNRLASNTLGDIAPGPCVVYTTNVGPAIPLTLTGMTFAQLTALGTNVPNGSLVYVTNGTLANPVAGGGTGCIAKRLNGVWVGN